MENGSYESGIVAMDQQYASEERPTAKVIAPTGKFDILGRCELFSMNKTIVAVCTVVAAVGLSVFIYKADPSVEGAPQQNPRDSNSLPLASANQATKSNPPTPEKMTDSLGDMLKEFERTKTLTDLNERSKKSADVIRALCLSGHVREAWEWIENEAGVVRKAQLAAFFRNADIPLKEFLSMAKALPYSGETKSALVSRSAGKTVAEIASMLDDSAFLEFIGTQDPKVLSGFLGESLYMRAGFGSKDHPERIAAQQEIQRLYKTGMVDENTYALSLENDSRPPFDKWELIASMKETERGSTPGELRKKVIDDMIMADPPQALAVLRKGPADQQFKDFYWGIKRWTGAAPGAANNWYNANRSNLNDMELGSAIRAFYDSAVEAKEFDGALQWANQMPDDGVKNYLIKQLEGQAK